MGAVVKKNVGCASKRAERDRGRLAVISRSSVRGQLRRRASGGEGEKDSGPAVNSGHGVSDNAHAAVTTTIVRAPAAEALRAKGLFER